MSPPIWLREPNLLDKKNPKLMQMRNCSSNKKDKSNENNHIADLLAELQAVLNENAQLQSENSSLRTEMVDLRIKNDNLLKAVDANKDKFEKDLNKLQEDIKINETHLIDNSKRCLLQQKKHVEEIKQLKSDNERLKLDNAKIATEFTEKIKNLESEIKLLQLSYKTVKSQNEDNAQKSTKYKNKLKYAITIINELNELLIQCTAKPDYVNRESQTEDERSTCFEDLHSSQSYTITHNQQHLDENLLLSDIFFKSKAFCEENELPLFNEPTILNSEETICL